MSEHLLFAQVYVVTYKECANAMPMPIYNKTHLCAGVAQGGVDACKVSDLKSFFKLLVI